MSHTPSPSALAKLIEVADKHRFGTAMVIVLYVLSILDSLLKH